MLYAPSQMAHTYVNLYPLQILKKYTQIQSCGPYLSSTKTSAASFSSVGTDVPRKHCSRVHPPGKRVQMTYWTKRSIRKKLHFTDERHDLVTAIRKYGVFADGPALPFRDTGFWARNGVSLHGKTSVSQNRLAIQTFERKMVCRGMENSSIGENPFTTGQWGRMRVGGQLRFHGCDFLLSLRPFFEKLRSVV